MKIRMNQRNNEIKTQPKEVSNVICIVLAITAVLLTDFNDAMNKTRN